MKRRQLRKDINQRISSKLRQARILQGKSLAQAAKALSIPLNELQTIEQCPAEVPANQLYKVIEYYRAQPAIETDLCGLPAR